MCKRWNVMCRVSKFSFLLHIPCELLARENFKLHISYFILHLMFHPAYFIFHIACAFLPVLVQLMGITLYRLWPMKYVGWSMKYTICSVKYEICVVPAQLMGITLYKSAGSLGMLLFTEGVCVILLATGGKNPQKSVSYEPYYINWRWH